MPSDTALGSASTAHRSSDIPTVRRHSVLTVAGLFAGVGGIEVGLDQAGHRTVLLCEIDAHAQRVLHFRFPGVPLSGDIRDLHDIPGVDVVAAGFPCQDLSQAGRTAGISGANSGVVDEVFRLVAQASRRPGWILLENVPFMLRLDGGRALKYVIERLERLGFSWAYRVVDTRAFGIPQRRLRVLLLASRDGDPRSVVLAQEVGEPRVPSFRGLANGFYWTEGTRGLGWAVDAIPTLKGGSTIGIPSPPAVWLPDDRIVTPDVRDAERLQGFSPDWTLPANGAGERKGVRWKLIGNAVSVPVARWIGAMLAWPGEYDPSLDARLRAGQPWPAAAWGGRGAAYAAAGRSAWPVSYPYTHLADFLEYGGSPLSARATEGFLRRVHASRLRFPPGFVGAIETHLTRVGRGIAA